MEKTKLKSFSFMEIFFLIIITSYAFDFGTIKYLLTWIFIVFDIFLTLKNNNFKYDLGSCGKTFIYILFGAIVLIAITILKQVNNGFHSYSINESIFLITPIAFTICLTKKMNVDKIETLMKLSFIIFIIAFIYKFSDVLSINNILSISFTNSYSPFESELAYLFLVYECFFIFNKNNKFAIISMIMCILSFKRLCCIFSILIYIVSKFINIYKEVNIKIVVITTIIFVVLPIATCFAIDNNIEGYLYSKYRISLDEITLSRTQRIELVLNSNQIRYGLGSTTTYLTEKLNSIHDSNLEQRNLHNDLVKFYLECGILGLAVLVFVYVKSFSKTKISFLMIIYILLECYFNHLFGAGTAYLWIIIYFFLAAQYKYGGKNE